MGKEKQGIEKMTDKEIQASDEEMEQFNILQNEKCVLAEEEKKDLNCEEEIKDLKIQCEYCKAHCGELFHFKLAKLNFNLEKKILELKKENADLKAEIGLNEVTIQEQLKERVKVIKENEELKKQIDCYKAFESHYDEIEEDAKAIAEENEDLKNQIKGFENDFDYQNKVIDKYKEDLKKLRVAYIQAQVANVISGTDFESILKSVLNG